MSVPSNKTASLLLALLLFTGCNYWPGNNSANNIDMAGTWSYRDGPITTTYILRADGSYTQSVTLPPSVPPPPDVNGTWSFADSNLNLRPAGTAAIESGINIPVTLNGDSVSFPGPATNSVFTRR